MGRPIRCSCRYWWYYSRQNYFQKCFRYVTNVHFNIIVITSYDIPNPHLTILSTLGRNSIAVKINAICIHLLGTTLSAETLNDATKMPDKPVLAFGEEPHTLSHSFMIRQSCALSYESASKLYTHLYLALEDYCLKYGKGLYICLLYTSPSPRDS